MNKSDLKSSYKIVFREIYGAMFRITLRKKLFLVLMILVILFSLIQQISGDICDICTCVENSCDSLYEYKCFDETREIYICDQNDEKLRKSNQKVDLNNILWPSRSVTTSVTFNNFKFTYLTK